MNDLRERVILPVAIPLAAIVVTEIVVFSMAQVLLASGTGPAVLVAVVAVVAIMAGAAAIAAAPRLRSTSIAGLLVLALIGTVAAGAWGYVKGPAPIEGHEEEDHDVMADIDVAAAKLEFDTSELVLAADEDTTIAFGNADGEQHNIAIFPDATSLNDPLFRGEIIQPGAEIVYDVGPLDAGVYYFHCDVHPQMNGSVIVT